MVMITALKELTMKNILLSEKRKAELINSLTIDEKLLYGAKLNYEGDVANTIATSDLEEMDGNLNFGNTTYVDGAKVFVNNKD